MTGWNLPPGVSGFEPEIAGYREREIARECDSLVPVVPRETLAAVLDLRESPQVLREFLERMLYETSDAHEFACGWTGSVSAYVINGEVKWKCPACGTACTEYTDDSDWWGNDDLAYEDTWW